MPERKTASIADLIAVTNKYLALPDDNFDSLTEGLSPAQAMRMGMAAILERTLFDNHAYHGYNFQPSEWKPEAERTTTSLALGVSNSPLRDEYDHTRRRYYSGNTYK